MRVSKTKALNTFKKLSKDIQKNNEKYSIKLYSFIRKYLPNGEITNENSKKLLDIFYKAFEDSFSLTSKVMKDLYINVEDFNIKHIKDLTFSKDGKDIEQRVLEWWKYYTDRIKDKIITLPEAIDYLFSRYDIILDNETKIVSTQVKKNKKPIIDENQYLIVVVDSGDCDGCSGGEYSYDETPWEEMPPRHTNCGCGWGIVITDDPDDINDLDLEEEDQE